MCVSVCMRVCVCVCVRMCVCMCIFSYVFVFINCINSIISNKIPNTPFLINSILQIKNSDLKSVFLPFTITAILTNPNEPKASLKSFEFASNGRSLKGFEKGLKWGRKECE
jgi:hypothetical protein